MYCLLTLYSYICEVIKNYTIIAQLIKILLYCILIPILSWTIMKGLT